MSGIGGRQGERLTQQRDSFGGAVLQEIADRQIVEHGTVLGW